MTRTTGRVVGAAVAILVAAAMTVAVIWARRHWEGWMVDLTVYRGGADAVRAGSPLYAFTSSRGLDFTYPPFAAIAFVPLTFLPPAYASALWTGVSLLCLEASLWICLTYGPHGFRGRALVLALAALGTAAFTWLDPVDTTLTLGQVNLVLMLIVLAGLLRTERWPLMGLAVGLAAAIKLTYLLFIVYLVATRRFKAAACAAGVFVLAALIGFAVLPRDSRTYWLNGTFANVKRIGHPQNVYSQSIGSVIVRLVHGSAGAWWIWAAVALPVAIAGLVVAAWYQRRGSAPVAVLTCAVTMLLVSPIAWEHHWVWIVPLLAFGAVGAWRARSARGWVMLAVLAGVFAARPFRWGVPHDHHMELWLSPVQQLYASWYVIAGLLLLATAAGVSLRSRASSTRSPERPRRAEGGRENGDRRTAPHDLDGLR